MGMAGSGRAKCKACKGNIQQKEPWVKATQAAGGGGYAMSGQQWHARCVPAEVMAGGAMNESIKQHV